MIDWHRAVREFFRTTEQGGEWDTDFIHADEAETSLGLLLFPEMVDMDYAVDTEGKQYLPDGHFDNSVDMFDRPHRWSEGEGHFAIEIKATPEGVVGKPTLGAAAQGQAAPGGHPALPDPGQGRDPGGVPRRQGSAGGEDDPAHRQAEMEPYLREPMSEGWKSVYALPKIGQDRAG